MQSENHLRRRAAARGLTLVKYREGSRWWSQYGPYALSDRQASNAIVAAGLDLADVADTLDR